MRRALAIAAVLIALYPAYDVRTADAQTICLSRRDMRQAIRSGVVMRPGRVVQRLGGSALRIYLCQGRVGLVWVVTMLGSDGRVVDLVVDAQSGRRLR